MLFFVQGNVVVTCKAEKPIRAVPPFLFIQTMKNFYFKTFLLCLLSFIGIEKAFAHDIAVANEDGVTIYYNYTNNGTELEVTYRGNS